MRIRLILIALIIFGHAMACPYIPAQAQDGATLRLGTSVLTQPDPIALTLNSLDARDLAENLYVGLFRYDAATRSAIPVLAEAWTPSADGLTWTFTLRDDIQWVHIDPMGRQVVALRPVTSEDFVYALRRACHPLRPNDDTPSLFIIDGCRTAAQINELVITDTMVAEHVRVEAPAPNTLILHLAFPAAYFPSLLTQPEFRPVAREAVEGAPGWSMVGSGPYVISAWTPGQSMSLVRNPLWPEDLPGNVERVELTFYPDDAARSEAFTNGEIDVARLGPAGSDNPQALVRRGATSTLLGFSTERAFVREAKVRQALAWAIDREALLAAVEPGRAAPILTLTMPGAIAAPPESAGVGFQPDAARAALAEAGYADCVGVPERIDFVVPAGAEALAQAVVAQWNANLGCDPSLFAIIPTPETLILNYARNLLDAEAEIARPHLWLVPWTALYVDAQSGAADAFHCRYGYFASGLACMPLDDLIEQAGSLLAADLRPAIYERLEARYFGPGGEYPAIPLLATTDVIGVAPNVQGAAAFGPAWWGEWQVGN